MTAAETIQTIASASTAVGVGIAAYQLWVGRAQRCAEFEQRMTVRFEEILGRIDLRYLLDDAPFNPEDATLRRAMYDYFVLCEEEKYYADAGRVTDGTWNEEWLPGIKANMDRPAFLGAWKAMAESSQAQFSC